MRSSLRPSASSKPIWFLKYRGRQPLAASTGEAVSRTRSSSDVAERTGRTRESIRLLTTGERGPGGFPAPATHFRVRQRMWRWQEVAGWFAGELGEPQLVGDPGRAQFITAFNAGLTWRRVAPELSRVDLERIRDTVGGPGD